MIKPARQYCLRAERTRLARQDNKHRLRDVLGVLWIIRLPQGRRINQANIPFHQFGKGCLRLITGKSLKQFGIRRIGHSPLYVRPPGNVTRFLFRLGVGHSGPSAKQVLPARATGRRRGTPALRSRTFCLYRKVNGKREANLALLLANLTI
jgi:hypothetical protein